MENVFASGDVPAIAESLATMRRSLLLVGDVPEFKGGMQRLEVSSHQIYGITSWLLRMHHYCGGSKPEYELQCCRLIT